MRVVITPDHEADLSVGANVVFIRVFRRGIDHALFTLTLGLPGARALRDVLTRAIILAEYAATPFDVPPPATPAKDTP